VLPPLSLPDEKWIQPVLEGPCRAGPVAGRGSAAVGRAMAGLVSMRRLMTPNLMVVESS